jgi:hypothetical protein
VTPLGNANAVIVRLGSSAVSVPRSVLVDGEATGLRDPILVPKALLGSKPALERHLAVGMAMAMARWLGGWVLRC